MEKREFIEAIVIRCANVPSAHPYFLVRFALQCWEHLEQYGDVNSAAMPGEVVSVVTGPREGFS